MRRETIGLFVLRILLIFHKGSSVEESNLLFAVARKYSRLIEHFIAHVYPRGNIFPDHDINLICDNQLLNICFPCYIVESKRTEIYFIFVAISYLTHTGYPINASIMNE